MESATLRNRKGNARGVVIIATFGMHSIFLSIAVAAAAMIERTVKTVGILTRTSDAHSTFAASPRVSGNFSRQCHLFWLTKRTRHLETPYFHQPLTIIHSCTFSLIRKQKKMTALRYASPSRSFRVLCTLQDHHGGTCGAGGGAAFAASPRLPPAPPIDQTLSVYGSVVDLECVRWRPGVQ